MPLFMSDAEWEREGGNVILVVARAELYIRELEQQLETHKTRADAVSSVDFTHERKKFLEGNVREHEAEVCRLQTTQDQLSQAKELREQHNEFLDEELMAILSALLEEQHNNAEIVADLHSKLAKAERAAKEAEEYLLQEKEHYSDLEAKLNRTQEELKFATEDAAIKDEQFNAEISTATKLVELYKQSSDEWSHKSHDLEAAIKALEAHLNEVEGEYKEKLDVKVKAQEKTAREAAESKEKLEKTLMGVNTDASKCAKDGGFLALPYNKSREGQIAFEFPGDGSVVPVVDSEVSGTALAAALLQDGWSLAKMYCKYQEAVDAWQHEKQECQRSQSLLERVLHEIEIRAVVIMEERVEHREMMEAYKELEEKLQNFMDDQIAIKSSYKDLKAELRKKERELKGQHEEISDLQIQVAVLLKECADIQQQRFGVSDQNGETVVEFTTSVGETAAGDAVISDKLLTFKDIRGMVEHNSQLRTLVRSLAQQNEQKEQELKEGFEAEMKQRFDELGHKVVDMIKQSEEQSDIIDRLQGTVGMYRRLYEEEVNAHRDSQLLNMGPVAENTCLRQLVDGSKEEIDKVHKEAATRMQLLEAELDNARQMITNACIKCAQADAEATSARDQVILLRKEIENQCKEMSTVLARNVEFSQAITDYQQKLQESSQKLQASEELVHWQNIEVAMLEKEKAILVSVERRASEEVASLSKCVHRLQASLDTIQTMEEAHEGARAAERKKLEDEVNQLQKEAKTELEMECAHGQNLIAQQDTAVSEALKQVELANKELSQALKAVSAAETHAQVTEARCWDLELQLKADEKIPVALGGTKNTISEEADAHDVDGEIVFSLQQAREELHQVKEDLAAAMAHTDQAEHRKECMETEVRALRKHISDLEAELSEKDKASADAAEEKEKALTSALRKVTALKDSEAKKQVALDEAEELNITLQQELDKLHLQWHDAQNNYERQVLLQADMIRELTVISDKLSRLENVERVLHAHTEKAEAELELLKVTWAVEKTSLEAAKADAEMKVKELDIQKHDRETLAELAVAKKEVEALKVTVTQMEEERESKGSQQLGELEGRVTELDQKLWEATQSEAAVKVELDCYKRLAQFQKRKLDGLGKEKEEASKEIDNLTKQIEELRSSAGKRTAGDQFMAAQEESLGHKEPVVCQEHEESHAGQEQAQKEIESKLREKETLILALERSLDKEKHQAKQWKSKKQKDLKLFYGVVQKAAAEKKRFLEELENLKHEKTYYESKVRVNGAGSLDEPPVKAMEINERALNYQVAINDMKKLADEVSPTHTPATPSVPASSTKAISDFPASIVILPSMIESMAAVNTSIGTVPSSTVIPPAAATASSAGGRVLSNSVLFPIAGPSSAMTAVPSTTVAIVSVPPGICPVTRLALAPMPVQPTVQETPALTAAVASAPAPALASSVESEHEILQLHARIQEQEATQAAKAAQACKTTCRLIKPWVEPVSTQEPNTEAGDLEGEGASADTEALAETRGIITEQVVESALTFSSWMPALSSAVASATAPVAESSAGPIVLAPSMAVVSIFRKRSAPLAESSVTDDTMSQEIKIERAPLQKKSRIAEVIHTISAQVVDDALAQFPKDSAELDMAGPFVPETALATREEQIMTVIEALVDEGEMLVTQETEAGEIVQEIVAPQGAEAEAIPLGSQEGEKEAPAMKGADEVNILSVDDQAPESAEDNGAGGDLVEQEVQEVGPALLKNQ
ncbi:hypothetical protein CY35_01G134800 [Sphagnum magellanicum]|nr:hypothetical protein CY35_01G134800 [Sphagnum magellanicum]